MKTGYHKSYEVTIRVNGRRIKTVSFHNEQNMIGFIDDIVMKHISEGADIKIVDDYRIEMKHKYNSYRITIVTVERQFTNIYNFYK